MSPTQLYWLITLPKFAEVVAPILGIGGGIVLFFMIMLNVLSGFETWDTIKKYIWIPSLSLFWGIIIGVFIPSTKEMVAIYGISYLTNDKNLQEIPPKLFEYANIKLDELIKE